MTAALAVWVYGLFCVLFVGVGGCAALMLLVLWRFMVQGRLCHCFLLYENMAAS